MININYPLPVEVLHKIFDKLSLIELSRAECVCQLWQKSINSAAFLHLQLASNYPHVFTIYREDPSSKDTVVALKNYWRIQSLIQLTLQKTIGETVEPSINWIINKEYGLQKPHICVDKFVFSSDSNHILTQNPFENSIKVCNSTGETFETLLWDNSAKTITYNNADSFFVSDDSQQILTTSIRDGTARVWNATSGMCTRLFEYKSVRSGAFLENQQLLLASDSSLYIESLSETESVTKKLTGHLKTIIAFAFSTDKQRVATASADNSVRVWDVQSGDCLHILNTVSKNNKEPVPADFAKSHYSYIENKSYPYFVMISPHRDTPQWILTAFPDQGIDLWDYKSGAFLYSLSETVTTQSVAFSPNGKLILTLTQNNTVCIFDPLARKTLHTVTAAQNESFTSAHFSSTSEWVIITTEKQLYIVDVVSGEKHDLWTLPHPKAFIKCAALSPDGKQLLMLAHNEGPYPSIFYTWNMLSVKTKEDNQSFYKNFLNKIPRLIKKGSEKIKYWRK